MHGRRCHEAMRCQRPTGVPAEVWSGPRPLDAGPRAARWVVSMLSGYPQGNHRVGGHGSLSLAFTVTAAASARKPFPCDTGRGSPWPLSCFWVRVGDQRRQPFSLEDGNQSLRSRQRPGPPGLAAQLPTGRQTISRPGGRLGWIGEGGWWAWPGVGSPTPPPLPFPSHPPRGVHPPRPGRSSPTPDSRWSVPASAGMGRPPTSSRSSSGSFSRPGSGHSDRGQFFPARRAMAAGQPPAGRPRSP